MKKEQLIEEYYHFRENISQDNEKIFINVDFMSTSELVEDFYGSSGFKDDETFDKLVNSIIDNQEFKDYFTIDFENKKVKMFSTEEVIEYIESDLEFLEYLKNRVLTICNNGVTIVYIGYASRQKHQEKRL